MNYTKLCRKTFYLIKNQNQNHEMNSTYNSSKKFGMEQYSLCLMLRLTY